MITGRSINAYLFTFTCLWLETHANEYIHLKFLCADTGACCKHLIIQCIGWPGESTVLVKQVWHTNSGFFDKCECSIWCLSTACSLGSDTVGRGVLWHSMVADARVWALGHEKITDATLVSCCFHKNQSQDCIINTPVNVSVPYLNKKTPHDLELHTAPHEHDCNLKSGYSHVLPMWWGYYKWCSYPGTVVFRAVLGHASGRVWKKWAKCEFAKRYPRLGYVASTWKMYKTE